MPARYGLKFDALISRLEEAFAVVVLLFSTSAVYSIWMGSRDAAALDTQGDVRGQAVWSAIYLAVILLSARDGRGIFAAMRTSRWALSLVALAALSIVWSDDPGFSMHRVIALCGTTLFAIYLSVRFTVLEQMRLLGHALIVGAVASVIAVVVLPTFAIEADYNNAWRGAFVDKNTMGSMMALGVAVFLLLAFTENRRSRWRIIAASLCGILVLFSRSATAVVMLFGFGAVVAVGPIFRMRWKLAIATVMASLPFAVAGVAWGSSHFDGLVEMLGRSSNLTGRTPLWQFVTDEIGRRPILGHGYDGFWAANGRDITLATAGWAAPHAHNGILELMLNLGVIGLVLFLISVAVLFRRALVAARNVACPYRLWPLLFFTCLVVYNVTLPGILERNNLLWILFVALSCSLYTTGREHMMGTR